MPHPERMQLCLVSDTPKTLLIFKYFYEFLSQSDNMAKCSLIGYEDSFSFGRLHKRQDPWARKQVIISMRTA